MSWAMAKLSNGTWMTALVLSDPAWRRSVISRFQFPTLILNFEFLKHGDAFYLYTDSAYRLILSRKYVDMIRNEKRLNFIKAHAVVRKVKPPLIKKGLTK